MGAGALTRENAGLVVKERLKNNSSAASMLRYLESHASLHAPPAIFARLLLFEAWQIINEDVFCAGTESFIRCHILRRANVLRLLPLSGWVREKEWKRKRGREILWERVAWEGSAWKKKRRTHGFVVDAVLSFP